MGRLEIVVGVALVCAGCGKRGAAAGPDAAVTPVVVDAATATARDAGGEADAGVGAGDVLLVEGVDGRRALVMLDEEAPKKRRDGGARGPELLAESPVVTAAVTVTREQLSEVARAHLAERWVLGGLGPKAPSCAVKATKLVDVARIVDGDPTLGEGTKGSELATRAFDQGAHVFAAVVEVPASCGAPAWAVREGAPSPRGIATASLDRAAGARLEKVLARASEAYKELPSKGSIETSFEATSVGDGRAWVRALRAEPGSPRMVCALLDVAAAPPKILAETSSCPAGVRGATQQGEDLVVWAGSGALRVHEGAVDAVFFPAASFVPYGAP